MFLFPIERSRYAGKAIERQLEEYQELFQTRGKALGSKKKKQRQSVVDSDVLSSFEPTERQIKEAGEKILQLKQELKNEKIARKNYEEYEKLRTKVNELPSRQETEV